MVYSLALNLLNNSHLLKPEYSLSSPNLQRLLFVTILLSHCSIKLKFCKFESSFWAGHLTAHPHRWERLWVAQMSFMTLKNSLLNSLITFCLHIFIAALLFPHLPKNSFGRKAERVPPFKTADPLKNLNSKNVCSTLHWVFPTFAVICKFWNGNKKAFYRLLVIHELSLLLLYSPETNIIKYFLPNFLWQIQSTMFLFHVFFM